MNAHDHQHHEHGHHTHKKGSPPHKDWRVWVVVGLMLAAMLMYVFSDDEALQPGADVPAERMPAAE